MTHDPKTLQMAVIGAPHGIRGEVRVKTFTGDPLALGDYGPLHATDGRKFTVSSIRPAKNVVVVRFKEIISRDAAEAITGVELFIDRAALPDDLEEDEFYHADLTGLAVRDETDAVIGKVTGVQNFGGGDIVEIALAGRRAAMVPFTLAAIPEIEIAQGFIRVDTQAAGLVDDDADDGEQDRGE
jgi:16S rRNA processing protein RimM